MVSVDLIVQALLEVEDDEIRRLVTASRGWGSVMTLNPLSHQAGWGAKHYTRQEDIGPLGVLGALYLNAWDKGTSIDMQGRQEPTFARLRVAFRQGVYGTGQRNFDQEYELDMGHPYKMKVLSLLHKFLRDVQEVAEKWKHTNPNHEVVDKAGQEVWALCNKLHFAIGDTGAVLFRRI